jgi:hypothetical protein
MFYLFKKVYLASDSIIDTFRDRVVISSTNGVKASQHIDMFPGALMACGSSIVDVIGPGKNFSNWYNFFKQLNDKTTATGKQVVVYCDNESLVSVWIAYMKYVLAKPDKDTCKALLESHVYRYEVFAKGRYSRNTTNTNIAFTIEQDNFDDEWAAISAPIEEDRANWLVINKDHLPVEYLLATYLKDGTYKDELKGQLKKLYKKDLEKFLLELKEIFYTHLTTSSLPASLSLAKTYTFENAREIEDDTTTYGELFNNRRYWMYPYMNYASSGKNINFDNITSTDITNLKAFADKAEDAFAEFTSLSESDKLDKIAIANGEFTDALLTTLIDDEAAYANQSGSFSSIDLETVNHYFVGAILSNKSDNAFLGKYSIT